MLPFIFCLFVFLESCSEQHLMCAGCCSAIHRDGAGFKGQVLGRSRALRTGQTGFGLCSVGFVLWAAAQVVIHQLVQQSYKGGLS